MPTYQEYMESARKADAAGDTEAASRLVALARSSRDSSSVIADSGKRPEMVSTVTGMTPGQAQSRAEAGQKALIQGVGEAAAPVIRYGIPMAASVAMPPLGAGWLASAASAAMAGGASAAPASVVAQWIEMNTGERKSFDGKEVGRDVLLNSAPIRGTGGFLRRAAFNVPSAVAASEVASAYDRGYNATALDASKRAVVPASVAAAASLLGAKGEKMVGAAAAKGDIAASRFGGSVMLSEILPERMSMEANQFARNNKNAVQALSNMDEKITDVIRREFPNVSPDSEIYGELADLGGKLRTLRVESEKLSQIAQQKEAVAQQARSLNSDQYPRLASEAKAAAMEVQKTDLLRSLQEGIFDGPVPELGSVASGRSINAVKNIYKSAEEMLSAGANELYGKAGIGLNDPVVNLAGIRNQVKNLSIKGEALEGNVAREIVNKQIGSYFGDGAPLGATLTLEQYRGLRDKIAKNLVDAGEPVASANRIAAGAYDAVREASNRFLSKNLDPERFAAWGNANAAESLRYRARESGFWEALNRGDSDAIVNRILKEGWDGGKSPIAQEVNAYGQIIAGSGDRLNPETVRRSMQAGIAFNESVSGVIRNELLNRSANSGLGRDVYNVDRLVKEIDAIGAKGFPVEQLGFGQPSVLKDLAKVASVGSSGGYTARELNEFLETAGRLGGGTAAARVQFNRAYRDAAIANGIRAKAKAEANLIKAANLAKADAGAAESAMRALEKDPLAQFMSDTKMRVPADAAGRMDVVNRLMGVDPDVAKGFVEAMQTSGRGSDLESLKKAFEAEVMRKFQPVASGGKIDTAGITETFFSESGPAKRAQSTLRNLLGDDRYQTIRDNFVLPMKRIADQQNKVMGAHIANNALPFRTVLSPGQTGGGTIYTNLKDIGGFIDRAQYNTLYTLYLDPKFAPGLAKLGGSIDKYAAQNPVFGVALRIAMKQDQDEAQVGR